MIKNHFDNNNDFTLVTKIVDKAYTLIKRDLHNNISKIIETREEGLSPLQGEKGYRFIFIKKEPILKY